MRDLLKQYLVNKFAPEEELGGSSPGVATPPDIAPVAPTPVSQVDPEQVISKLLQESPQRVNEARDLARKKNFQANVGSGLDTIVAGLAGTNPRDDYYKGLVSQNNQELKNELDSRGDVIKNYLEQKRLANAQQRLDQADERLGISHTKVDQADERIGLSKKRYGLSEKKEDRQEEKEERERSVPGFGKATSKKMAEGMQELVAETEKGKTAVNQLLRISNTPFKEGDLDAIGEARIAVATLKGAMRIQVTGGGNISDSEQKLLSQIAVDPTKIWKLDRVQRATLNGLLKTMNRNIETAAKARGLNIPDQYAGNVKIKFKGKTYSIPKKDLPAAQKDGAELLE